MTQFNEYQKMHHSVIYPKKGVAKKQTQLWKLVYNKTEICVKQGPYRLCNGMKTKLIATGRYQKKLFTIDKV